MRAETYKLQYRVIRLSVYQHQVWFDVRVKGTRELVVHQNYILIYRIVGEVVEVLRVKHGAQK